MRSSGIYLTEDSVKTGRPCGKVRSSFPELKMWRRFFSDTKVYTGTVNLPKTKFPGRLKPKERLDVQKRLNQVGQ